MISTALPLIIQNQVPDSAKISQATDAIASLVLTPGLQKQAESLGKQSASIKAAIAKLDPNAGGGGGRDDEIWGSSKNGDTTSKGSSGGSGLGGGSLQLVWGNYSTGQGPEDLAVGDLDMDGAKDVITADQDGDTFSILLGDGSGGLGSSISFDLGAGAEPRSIDCGDLDGDGDIDIAIICDDTNGDRVLRVYENTLISGGTAGTYGFTSTSDLLTILGATIVRLDDVDNDGIDDTLTATSPASPLVGGTNSELEFLVSNQGRGKPTCVGDLNDDGSINGADLGLLIAGWGPCVDEDCIGDLNEDGTVNGADLGLMIASWGPCTVNQ